LSLENGKYVVEATKTVPIEDKPLMNKSPRSKLRGISATLLE